MPATQRLARPLFFIVPILLLLVGLLLLAQIDTAKAADEPDRPAGWSDETHSNDVDPNYAVVFPTDEVNQITITVTAENWEAMQADMTSLYGEPRSGGPAGMPVLPGGAPPADRLAPADGGVLAQPPSPLDRQAPGAFVVPGPGQRPGGAGPFGMGGSFTTTNPIWVTGTVEFEGNVWTDVGVRFKGNSSLMSAWNSGSRKMPFKLDFDEFEDVYPGIKNQRFYGFKQLSLGNNFSDDAMMRDALAYDVYEEAGLVAANTGFYQVFLDHGKGPVNLGLYTVVEVIDDTVVDRAFGGGDGNLYEGDGRNIGLAAGTAAAEIEESFQKENNEDEADWSDILALYDVLHSDVRTTAPDTWRAELEKVFDVDTFLKWLAVSAQIGHWDTYGAMTHNFYIYNDPESGQLTWITWDHNMTFSGGMGGPGGAMPRVAAGPNAAASVTATASLTRTASVTTSVTAAPNSGPNVDRINRGGPRRGVSLDKADVGDNWPLIRFLLDDPVYYERYVGYLAESSIILESAAMTERIETYADLLAPYAGEEIGAESYTTAVQRVIDYVTTRAEEMQTFLAD